MLSTVGIHSSILLKAVTTVTETAQRQSKYNCFEKVRENRCFFKVREKSGNFKSSQTNSKFYLEGSKKSGNLSFGQQLGLRHSLLGGRDGVVSKNSCVVADLSPMVSETLRNYFCIPMCGNSVAGIC